MLHLSASLSAEPNPEFRGSITKKHHENKQKKRHKSPLFEKSQRKKVITAREGKLGTKNRRDEKESLLLSVPGKNRLAART